VNQSSGEGEGGIALEASCGFWELARMAAKPLSEKERRVNPPRSTGRGSAPPVNRRQGIRYPGRDYRIPAFCLITMTTLDRRPRFAACADKCVTLTDEGQIVRDCWQRMARAYPEIKLSTLAIMPDHLHGIVRVTEQMQKPVGVPFHRASRSRFTYRGRADKICAHET